VPIDRLALGGQPQAQRDARGVGLCRLSVREFFDMQLVQTDPNFGNYLFDAATAAWRCWTSAPPKPCPPNAWRNCARWAAPCADDDVQRIRAAGVAGGFIADVDPPVQAQAIVDLMQAASEPLRHVGPYDFGASSLVARVFDQGKAQYLGEGFARTPPPDLLFLQRKFIGTFLLVHKAAGAGGRGGAVCALPGHSGLRPGWPAAAACAMPASALAIVFAW
jgi:aarF domain-containing kinase